MASEWKEVDPINAMANYDMHSGAEWREWSPFNKEWMPWYGVMAARICRYQFRYFDNPYVSRWQPITEPPVMKPREPEYLRIDLERTHWAMYAAAALSYGRTPKGAADCATQMLELEREVCEE